MNLNIFTPINLENISKLPFIEKTVPYMYAANRFQNSPIWYGAIHVINYESYQKIESRFIGTDVKITAGAKAYVLPNCSIPQFKIKDILKSLNASFTNDYTKATIFIGSKNAMKESSQKKETINILGGYSYYNIKSLESNSKEYTSSIYPDLYLNACKFYVNANFNSIKSLSTGYDDVRFLFPLGTNILFKILSEKIPVISEESLLSQSAESCIITEELYYSLKDMLESDDEENKALALHTIANSNIKESIVYIYFIAREFYTEFKFSRFKNIKLFYTQGNIDTLKDMGPGEFISKLIKEDITKITPEIFKAIVTQEANSIIDNDNIKSDLFDIIIIPKSKFSKFHNNLSFKYELSNE